MICSTWCTYMTMYLYNDMHFKHTCHRSTLVLQATRLTLRYTVATASASLYNNSSKGSKGSSKESRSGGIKRIKRIKWDRVGSSVKDQEGCKGSRGLQGGNRGVLSSMQWTTEHMSSMQWTTEHISSMQWTTEHMSSMQWTTVEHAMNNWTHVEHAMNNCRACNEHEHMSSMQWTTEHI